ncbi:hypothetical protein SNE40_016315 [Patella caerulea]|uniref:C-type lectin domain-containing protein n=1 Tax=Patella caerulea TaxID=87958 RepID=A0AAN8PIP9_PATCE
MMLILVLYVLLITSVEGSNFFYHEELKTYHDARTICQSSGLDLLVLKSADEIGVLNEFLSNLSSITQHIWIGLDKYDGKNNFTWLDNREISYNNWETDEPDGWGYQHCVCIQKTNLRWNSRTCGTKMYFICGLVDENSNTITGSMLIEGPFYLLSRDTSILSNSTLTYGTKRNIRCAKYCIRHSDCKYFTLSESGCIVHIQAVENSVYTIDGMNLWTKR